MADSGQLIIGIDGGGTGCRVAVETASGVRLAETTGRAANYTTDTAGAVESVCAALHEVLDKAGLSDDAARRSRAHVGLAGILGEAQADALRAALPFDRLSVSDDRVTSTAGALGRDDGVLAAVGTGSFVVSRREGVTRFFGGWGLRVGDQASGAWLGQRLLEQCLLVHDGLAESSDLATATLDRFGSDPAAIVAFARDAAPQDYGALAPSVVAAAEARDIHGTLLMRTGAAYLTTCFQAAGLGRGDAVCLTGGVGPHYARYLSPEVQDRLRPPRGSALDGALFIARHGGAS